MEKRIPSDILDPKRKEDLNWDYHEFDVRRLKMAEIILALEDALGVNSAQGDYRERLKDLAGLLGFTLVEEDR